MAGSSKSWTPEKRARQAKILRQRKPWLNSTGPATAAGKDAVKHNALKHGFRSVEYQKLCALLRAQAEFVKDIVRDPLAFDDKHR